MVGMEISTSECWTPESSKIQGKLRVYTSEGEIREILEVASMDREALCSLRIQWRLGVVIEGRK